VQRAFALITPAAAAVSQSVRTARGAGASPPEQRCSVAPLQAAYHYPLTPTELPPITDPRSAAPPRNAPGSADAWRGLALLALTLAAYWPALLGDFVWDDDAHVTRMALRSLDGLRDIWVKLGATQQYYPLLHSAFWIEAKLWGDYVLGYHLVNVVLHVIAACLVVTVCQRLSIKGAWLAGAIFALHPVNVESVAWISEQKNTLSLVFYLLAALAYLRFDDARKPRDYAAASALFACALLTKTVTASLPAALLVVFWWKRGADARERGRRIEWTRDVLPLVPWFLVAAASGLFTAWVERHLIGAEGSEYNLDVLQRALLAGRVIWFYFDKLLWPTNLIFTYPHWTVDARVAWQYAFDVGLVAIAAWFWTLRVRTRAPLAALLFFGGSLFPVLGFLDIYPFRYSYVADHFVYLASLGVIVPLAAVATLAVEQVILPAWLRRAQDVSPARITPAAKLGALSSCAVLALLVTLATLSNRQSRMYADAKTLYRATLARNPDDWMAHQNLGIIYSRGALHRAEAIEQFEDVIRLKPEHNRAHYNLGLQLYISGRGPEAVEHFQKAIKYAPTNKLIVGYSLEFLGTIYTSMPGRLPEAIATLDSAVALRPDDAESRHALGLALQNAGRAAEAKVQLDSAAVLRPDLFGRLGSR
jgi:Flp pilus assembly protein TadD